jgi:hypothetical protein
MPLGNAVGMLRRAAPAALLSLALPGCAPHPAPPRILPELTLDIAEPIVEARIGAAVLRLRVDLDRRNSVELNPAAAARLALPFEDGMGLLVGRVELRERTVAAPVTIGGVTVPLTLSTYDRDCCTGSDGAIGPDLLPYGSVRFIRAGGVPGATTELHLPLVSRAETGLSAPTQTAAGELFVGFSLGQAETLATAAAGAILTAAQGGRFAGSNFDVAPAFGVRRPARLIRFDRPAILAGFRIAEVPVRVGDFGGGRKLPEDPALAGEIVVQRRRAAQPAWPAILIGRDRIDRCAEIRFQRAPMALTLRCTFDVPVP